MKPKYSFLANWGYACAGLRDIWANERSFRIEICLFIPLILAQILFKISLALHLLLVASLLFVLVMECINSAIERVVDLAQPDFHPLAGAAKDAASAAVNLAIILAIVVWGAIFFGMLG